MTTGMTTKSMSCLVTGKTGSSAPRTQGKFGVTQRGGERRRREQKQTGEPGNVIPVVGTTVVLASRSAACCTAAEQLSARTRATVHGRACDVTDERAVGALTEEVLARHGRIDVLVTS